MTESTDFSAVYLPEAVFPADGQICVNYGWTFVRETVIMTPAETRRALAAHAGNAARRRPEEERMKNLILIGMPGTGKSAVGRELARRLEYTFLDVDDVIRERTGKTLKELLEEGGVDAFIRLEGQIGESLTVPVCVGFAPVRIFHGALKEICSIVEACGIRAVILLDLIAVGHVPGLICHNKCRGDLAAHLELAAVELVYIEILVDVAVYVYVAVPACKALNIAVAVYPAAGAVGGIYAASVKMLLRKAFFQLAVVFPQLLMQAPQRLAVPANAVRLVFL